MCEKNQMIELINEDINPIISEMIKVADSFFERNQNMDFKKKVDTLNYEYLIEEDLDGLTWLYVMNADASRVNSYFKVLSKYSMESMIIHNPEQVKENLPLDESLDNDLKDLYVLNHLANYADDKIIERIRQYCECKPNFVESFTLANTLNKVTDLFIGNKNVRVDYVPPVKQNYAKIMIVFKTSSSDTEFVITLSELKCEFRNSSVTALI